ncbi:MAG: lytic murein transglycosylase B [Epsilonproteobacteria bacterium]|nr:lytic murein transglycosylase B [Campylobacterota bacterium]
MKYKNIILLISILILSSGCVKKEAKPKPSSIVINGTEPTVITQPVEQQPIIIEQQPVIITQPQQQVSPIANIHSPYLMGVYANNPKLRRFIEEMINKYHFRRDYLYGLFSNVNRDVLALKKYNVFGTSKPTLKSNSVGSWDKYPKFATEDRIINGVRFWRSYRYYLEKAAFIYGVAPEYILGIIGVETNFGRDTGKHRVIDALTSLSLEYRKRSDFFTKQLEEYLLLTKEQRLNPLAIKGSYGGAFGIVQFMPDSFRDYAVDFDGDGKADLFNPADAIGSTANFFVKKGKWNPKIPVAVRVTYPKKRLYGVKTGYKTTYSQSYLRGLGMRPVNNFYGYKGPVCLIKLSHYDRDELWWGTNNFKAIARYNPRDYYVMSVHLLAQAIKQRYYQMYRD